MNYNFIDCLYNLLKGVYLKLDQKKRSSSNNSAKFIITKYVHYRQIQTYHINNDNIEDDIGYNFLVGGDGAAYEGRGWNLLGAHTRGYNSRSIGVAFIGNFVNVKPPKRQVIALLKLLRDGVQKGKISENYILIGANQVRPYDSPGKMLSEILQELPHWSDPIDY